MVETEEGVIDDDTNFVWIANPTSMMVEIKKDMKIAKIRKIVEIEEEKKIEAKETKEDIDITKEEAEEAIKNGNLSNKEKKHIQKVRWKSHLSCVRG